MVHKLKQVVISKPFVFAIWFGLSLFAVIKSVVLGHSHIHNNYLVYKHNFLHVIHQQPLYAFYPESYFDLNHYGPVFSLVIAPFALLPDEFGVILWVVFNCWILMKAIQLLPIKQDQYLIILLLCAHELMTSASNTQSNPLVAALIILSYVFVKDKKDFWAALMITLGLFIKLYGIVGLAFFFFSDNKLKLIASLLFWSLVLFVLPMVISSPGFIMQSYKDWYTDLVHKNSENIANFRQNVSVIGMIQRVFLANLSTLFFLIPGVILFLSTYIRVKSFKNFNYQLLIVASTLIFTVIFSTGSESSTYIIAFVGVAIWYINLQKPVSFINTALLIFALLLTSLSPSDLFPRYLRLNYIEPYSLKALPCLLIWLKIIYETWFRKFFKNDSAMFPNKNISPETA